MDLPEFRAWVAEVEGRIEQITKERDEAQAEADEWEDRYEWLLGESGGTAPTSRHSS